MNMKIARRCSSFFAVVVTLSSVMACSVEGVDEPSSPESQPTAAATTQETAPVQTDTTSPSALTGLVSVGESSEGLFCTLCRAQGCDCAGSSCINCGVIKTR